MLILANRLACVLVAVCLAPASILSAASSDRQPAPSTEAQAAAMARLNKQFDFAELRKKEEPGKLAGAMLQQAIDTNEDPDLKYVLFLRARELAIEAHDAKVAMASIDELAKQFDVDVLGAKTATLQGLLKGAKSDEVHVSNQIERLTEEAMASDRYDLADDLVALSERLASSDQVKREHRQRRTEIRAMQQKFATLQQALADLEKSPADPDLNLAVGRYLTYYKGDWRRGIPMLALGSEPRLSEMAQRELRLPAAAVEIKQLGDDWWNLSASEASLPKKNVQDHAIELYRRALPGLEGLDKLAVEKRLPAPARVVKQQKPPTGKWVKIVNKSSGLAAGVTSNRQPRRVKQHEFKAEMEGLHWQIQPVGEEYFKIVNKGNGHVMAIAGGSEDDGARAVIYPFKETAMDHQWKFESTADGSFRLINRNSKRVLGVDRRSRSAGAELSQWELLKDDPADQHWQVIQIEP